jgi:hypothetical protein
MLSRIAASAEKDFTEANATYAAGRQKLPEN